MLFNRKQTLNFGVSEETGMKCMLYTLKDCNAYSDLIFRYGGEKLWRKADILFQSWVNIYIQDFLCPCGVAPLLSLTILQCRCYLLSILMFL